MHVILHIGTPKTGSTAVQSFLYENRASLLESGIIYPMTGLTVSDSFGPRHKGLTHKAHNNIGRWRALREELKLSGAHTAVLSCEAFWRYSQRAPELRAKLARHAFEIIVYLRRQDRLLTSWYAHTLVHHGSIQLAEFFEKQAPLLDYNALIACWEAAFEKVTVRSYPEGSNVVPDFLASTGLPGVEKAQRFEALNVSARVPPLDDDNFRALRETFSTGNQILVSRHPHLTDLIRWSD